MNIVIVFTVSKNTPIVPEIAENIAAVCATAGELARAAIPVPVTVNIASANGCRSQPKLILLISKLFLKEIANSLISIFIKAIQITPQTISAGSMNVCKLSDSCGAKYLIGPMNTFIVITSEMNGAIIAELVRGFWMNFV